jgi:hypothetical protein
MAQPKDISVAEDLERGAALHIRTRAVAIQLRGAILRV